MDRSKIIKRFLDSGHQLTNDALDILIKEPEKVEAFLKEAKQHNTPSAITSEFLTTFLKKGEKKREIKLTPDDYTNIFTKRLEVMKNIFSQKTGQSNLISINKISPRTKKFSIIGMVKETDTNNNTIILEDNTGEIEIQLQNKPIFKEIVEDEILNITCEKTGEIVVGESVFFPDMSIKREINKTKDDVYCFFISDLHMDSDSFNKTYYINYINWLENEKEKINIFVVGDVSTRIKDIEKLLSDTPKRHNISIIKGEIDPPMEKLLQNPHNVQIGNVNMVLFHNPKLNHYINLWGSPEKAIANLLKKRHLDPIFTADTTIYNKDPYLLETTPDIIVAGHTHIPTNTNYKGTTILTLGSLISQPIFWLMNLRTREIFKKDFS